MRTTLSLLPVACLALAGLGCSGDNRTEGTDGGGVALSITDFDELPIQVSVNTTAAAGGIVQLGSVTIQSIAKVPVSDLSNVEIDTYEVTYTRADTGSRVPPPLVRGIFGVVPAGGINEYEGLPIVTSEQILTTPLSDLLFQNGGFDRETGSQVIRLNMSLRFFGRTISGENVDTAPALFTVEFLP